MFAQVRGYGGYFETRRSGGYFHVEVTTGRPDHKV